MSCFADAALAPTGVAQAAGCGPTGLNWLAELCTLRWKHMQDCKLPRFLAEQLKHVPLRAQGLTYKSLDCVERDTR